MTTYGRNGWPREMAALLNLRGGRILLGVDDDGTVRGLARDPKAVEERVMEIARAHVRPATIPYWETIDWDGARVGVISLPADAPDKPYKAKRGSAWVTQTRAGTTTRDASDEEKARLYMQSGRLPYDRRPLPGSSFDDLDHRRLVNYFRDVRGQYCPRDSDSDAWIRLLVNAELMVEDRDRVMASAAGLLLFGRRPGRLLPQAGISAAAYPGHEKDYGAKARTTLRGPLTPLHPVPETDPGSLYSAYPAMPRTFSEYSGTVEGGIIEGALDFVRRHTDVTAWDRRRRPPAGTLGLSAGHGARDHRERRRAPRLHDHGHRHRAGPVQRPAGGRLAGPAAEHGDRRTHADRLPRRAERADA